MHKLEVLFYIKSSDLPKKPAPKTVMRFDDHRYQVHRCDEDGGVYKIILELNR